MVQLAGLAIFGSTGGLTVAGIALTNAVGGATFFGTLVNVGISSLISRGGRKTPRPEDLQVNRKTSVGERIQHVGRVKVGGTVVFHRANSGVSYRVIVLGDGEIDSFQRFDLDRRPVVVDGAGGVTDRYLLGSAPRVTILDRSGASPEAHYSEITSVWPEWTSSHTLNGLSSVLAVCASVDAKRQGSVFPFGEPEVQAVMDTLICDDPRTNTRGFTENAALIISEFAKMDNGLGRDDVFDDADIAAEADIAGELVPVVGGGSEARFRLAGSYSLSSSPSSALLAMLESTGARIRPKLNGKFAIRFPRAETPTVTITGRDILQVSSFSSGPDLAERYSKRSATYLSQALNFTSTTCNPVINSGLVSSYGGEIRAEPLDLPLCPSQRQAQEATSAKMVWENYLEEHDLILRAVGLEVFPEWAVTIDAPEFGLSGKYYVVEPSLQMDGGLLSRVRVRVRKIDEGGLAVRTVQEQGPEQTLPTNSNPQDGIPLPANVAAAGHGVAASEGTFTAGISIAFDAAVEDSLTPLVEFRGAGGAVAPATWTPVVIGQDATSAEIGGLVDGQNYDVLVLFMSASGQRGPEVTISNVTAKAVTSAPAAPSNLAVSDAGSSTAQISVTASGDAANRRTVIYRDGVEVHSEITPPGAAVSYVDACGAGTFDWTARAFNVSGTASNTDAGPETATIA